MSVRALEPPGLFAACGISTRAPSKTRSGPPVGTSEILVPAYCSAIGLLISMPYLSLLSRALADDSASGFLVLLLR